MPRHPQSRERDQIGIPLRWSETFVDTQVTVSRKVKVYLHALGAASSTGFIVHSVSHNSNLTPPHTTSDSDIVEKKFGPAMLFLPRQPCEEDWGESSSCYKYKIYSSIASGMVV
ncbi:hypothetical protein SDJN03_09037, partial [Cucurbita argyrosperma subsp. sororia]